MNEPHNTQREQVCAEQQTQLSLMDIRSKSLGGKSYCNNPESYRLRKIIRSNIKDIYFFGQETTEEEIVSFEWR